MRSRKKKLTTTKGEFNANTSAGTRTSFAPGSNAANVEPQWPTFTSTATSASTEILYPEWRDTSRRAVTPGACTIEILTSSTRLQRESQHCYLEAPAKKVSTLGLRCLFHPMRSLLITGCYTFHHPKDRRSRTHGTTTVWGQRCGRSMAQKSQRQGLGCRAYSG